MRYYVLSIEFNREKASENRTAPKAYDTYDDAIIEFHSRLAADMKNDSLGWALVMVFDNEGNTRRVEKWTREEEIQLEEL